MSNGDRWMPLYVADYLGDTMHLTGPEHGAYLLLLMHYWRNGPLPDDDRKLAHIARTEASLWKSIGPVIREFFTVNGDGTLHQKRMDWEVRRWGEISGKRRAAGKRGAEAKHRPHPSNGGGPPAPLPQKPPEVVPRHVIPQPGDGKRMAIATNLPVDNLANARVLPPEKLANAKQVPELCHDFASAPVPVQRKSYLLSSQEEGAREGETGETRQNLPRETDHLELILRESLEQADAAHKASLMPHERKHTLSEQHAAAAKPQRSKACYVTGTPLALLRKQAGIWVAPPQ
jgi:uncharacterized protein YdaU (DUF1376 family)